ncbi:MAG: hypothetical protein HUU54_16775 [Ignavibacteriaceae bacterium]|nr:hypothetical protein [Ignavibacteriaceae bacterium]
MIKQQLSKMAQGVRRTEIREQGTEIREQGIENRDRLKRKGIGGLD